MPMSMSVFMLIKFVIVGVTKQCWPNYLGRVSVTDLLKVLTHEIRTSDICPHGA